MNSEQYSNHVETLIDTAQHSAIACGLGVLREKEHIVILYKTRFVRNYLEYIELCFTDHSFIHRYDKKYGSIPKT